MGFGILFLGYFVGLIIGLGYLSVFRVAGAVMTTVAALKLRRYDRKFDLLLIASIINLAFYGVKSVMDLLVLLGMMSGEGIVQTAMLFLHYPITFGFHVCLLIGIRSIAKDTDSQSIFFGATRNIVFHGIVFVFQIVTLLPVKILNNLSVLAIIFHLVLTIFDLVLIFRSYAQICDEDDVEMEQKPSRFAFVNRMRKEMEERRLEADREREEKKQQKRKK